MPVVVVKDVHTSEEYSYGLRDGSCRVRIGRSGSNEIILNGSDSEVAEEHAEIRSSDGKFVLTNLDPVHGVTVGGGHLKVGMPIAVHTGDVFSIPGYELYIGGQEDEDRFETLRRRRERARLTRAVDRVKEKIFQALYSEINLRRHVAAGDTDDQIRARASQLIIKLVRQYESELPREVTGEQVERDIFREAFGLGLLEDIFEDKSVTEVMVVGHESVYVERNGKVQLSEQKFSSEERLLLIIERIVATQGKRIDEMQPYVDTRLADGSRVNAVIAPLALDGPLLTIRRFPERRLSMQDLLKFGSISLDMAEFLRLCVLHRENIIISGGTGSGKTTFLNILSGAIPGHERIVTIEDAAELQLPQEHVARMESKPPGIEGTGQITIRDLVRNSLRMRPDRIVVGECRGGEALDMLQAMNTGHDGSLTTVHANSPSDATARIATLSLMAGMDMPERSIRAQIASAVDVIVQQARMADGSRKITSISEVVGLENEQIVLQETFRFRQEGIDDEGKVRGTFLFCGCEPLLFRKLKEKGITTPFVQSLRKHYVQEK